MDKALGKKKKMPNENIQYNKFSIFDSVSFLNL